MSDKAGAGLAGGLTDYGDKEFARYLRRSFARSMGYSDAFLDRPIVGICTTASDFNNCHRGMDELVEAAKRGIIAAGALPLAFPVISLGEPFLAPTSMKYRNLMAMAVEEMIRAQPMDAVLLVGGCDKTVPALLMGAISAGKPAALLVTGPMLTGHLDGERLGACTDCRRFWGRFRAGELDQAAINRVERRLAVTRGTCAVMGTASTMACIAETMGFMPAGAAAIPAVHADRLRAAEETGTLAAQLIGSDRTPDTLVTKASVDNALRVLLSLSGSTNAVVHLAAIAGRAGVEMPLAHLDELSDQTPVLVNLKPVGDGYMEDFYAAGGIPALLQELAPFLDLTCPVVEGGTLGQRLEQPLDEPVDRRVIAQRSQPVSNVGGLIALKGSLAPGGAILKRAAATPTLFEHEARAIVFHSLADMAARIDDPELDVLADDILVLQNAGPASSSAMPEAGYLPIPKKLARQGVKDMVRISDARMSGTAFGTIVLHIAPDAGSGGPLALVRSGDRIRLSVTKRRLDLLVDDDELERRRAYRTPTAMPPRGYANIYAREITQAPQGCDFKALRAAAEA